MQSLSNTVSGKNVAVQDAERRIREISGRADAEKLFAALPHPFLVQSPAYGEAVRRARGLQLRYLCYEHDGVPTALVQVRTKHVIGLPVFSRIEQGPMFFDPSPSLELRRDILGQVRRHFHVFRGMPAKILPGLEKSDENLALLTELGYRDLKTGGWWSARIDLSLSEDQLRANLSSSWRKQLNGSIRKGLKLEVSSSPASVRWLLERHRENMNTKGFVGPDCELTIALYEAAPEHFHVLTATMNGEPLCSACWIRFGACAQSLVGWFGPAGRAVNAGNFLYWHAMLEMKKRGCKWFDVGGLYRGHGYTHFKQGMGGTEYELCGDWLSY